MPSTVPSPVAAALGIVPTVLSGVRSLPGKAVQLPVLCVSSALNNLDRTRRGYDELAERGERLIARLRGTSFDELEDTFEDALQGTPLAAPYDKVEDALEDVTENVTAFVRSVPGRARKATGAGIDKAGDAASAVADAPDASSDLIGSVADTAQAATSPAADAVADGADAVANAVAKGADVATDAAAQGADAVADAAEKASKAAAQGADAVTDAAEKATDAADKADDATAADEAPKGVATPKATQPDMTPVETAATPEVVAAVERVSAQVGGDVVDREELALPDFDHLTLGAVRGRMRALDLPQLVQLRDYEKSKGNRLPIVTMLDNRIAKLATDPTATPSGAGAATAKAPAKKAAAKRAPAKRAGKGQSKVSPATANKAANAPTAAFGGLGTSVPDKG